MPPLPPSLRRWPAAAALVLIALATLVPTGASRPRFQWRLEIPDVAVNLALYFPLGLLLAWLGLRRNRIALWSVLCSGGIEMLQGLVIPGRLGSLVDVVANLAGALLGAVVWDAATRALRSTRPGARVGLAAVMAAPALAWLFSFVPLAPSPPPVRTWYSLWAHHFRDTEPFRGTVIEVRLQGRPVPDGFIYEVPELLADARSQGLLLGVTIVSDGPTGGPTQLASIGDLRENTVIGLEQAGDDLLLFWESRGSAYSLRPPRVTFAGLGRAERGQRLAIQASVTAFRASIRVETGGTERTAALRLTPLTGWRSLIPSRALSAGAQRLFDVVWTLGFVGYLLIAFRLFRPVRISY